MDWKIEADPEAVKALQSLYKLESAKQVKPTQATPQSTQSQPKQPLSVKQPQTKPQAASIPQPTPDPATLRHNDTANATISKTAALQQPQTFTFSSLKEPSAAQPWQHRQPQKKTQGQPNPEAQSEKSKQQDPPKLPKLQYKPSYSFLTPPPEERPSSTVCKVCGNHVVGSRTICGVCGTPRGAEPIAQPATGSKIGNSAPAYQFKLQTPDIQPYQQLHNAKLKQPQTPKSSLASTMAAVFRFVRH